MTDPSVTLRCQASKGNGLRCLAPVCSVPIPAGGFVDFIATAKALPPPEQRKGDLWVSCKSCGRWSSFRVLVVPPLADSA